MSEDVIVASERARFGMLFIKMGLVPELASTHFLVQRVGFAKASELCLSGRLYSAGELAGFGLFNGLVPPEELLPRTYELANEIAGNPDPQLRMIKDLLTRNGTEPDLKSVQSREIELLRRCYETPEHREAVSAFSMMRRPKAGLSASQVESRSLTRLSTMPRTSLLPSFVFVWPSNCGSGTFTERTATRPSLTSSPERLASFFLSMLLF